MIHLFGKIPFKIRPGFWIVSLIFAFLLGGSAFDQVALWFLIIFLSVFVHELGHALSASAFGKEPRIELVPMGGVTYYEVENLSLFKQFLITLMGPLFGLLLGAASYVLSQVPTVSQGPFYLFLQNLAWINFFWTAVNLLPILPLDGGQLVRLVLTSIFKIKAVHYTLCVSSILSFVIALFFFLTQNFLAGAVFFLFAFENFIGFRKTVLLYQSDEKASLKEALLHAEEELEKGHKKEALDAFEKIREEAKEGMIYTTAAQYAAFLEYESGKREEAYQHLKTLKEKLDPEGLFLLHQVAYEEKDFSLVADLGGEVFQIFPFVDVALRSAYAFGNLTQVTPALGWLETSLDCGLANIQEVLKDPAFDPIRQDPLFLQFQRRFSVS